MCFFAVLFGDGVGDVQCVATIAEYLRVGGDVLRDVAAVFVDERAFADADTGGDGAVVFDFRACADAHAIADDDVVSGEQGFGEDVYVIADFDIAQHFDAGADEAIVANFGVAVGEYLGAGFPWVGVVAQRYLVHDLGVFTDGGGFAEYVAGAVVNEKIIADGGAGVNVYAGARLGGLGQFAGAEHAALFIHVVGDVVNGYGDDAGIYLQALRGFFAGDAFEGCVFGNGDIYEFGMLFQIGARDVVNLVLEFGLAADECDHMIMPLGSKAFLFLWVDMVVAC